MKGIHFSGKKSAAKQYAVLGLGRFGQSVVQTLVQNGCNVLACDLDHGVVHEAASYATHVVQADVTDEKNLESIGIGNFDVVVIAIGGDFEAAVMATMIAKEKGAGYVLTKASGLRQKKILQSVGADKVVLPELEMGEKTATSLITSNIVDYINISDKYAIAEISPASDWIGKTLESARLRADKSINVIAIRRGNSTIVSPRASEAILQNDMLVVISENDAIKGIKD